MVHNVKLALKGFPIRNIYGWLDSTVALHWINGEGNYKQFVANRVKANQSEGVHDMVSAEAKTNKEVLSVTVEEKSRLEEALEKHGLWITMRITAWINRFVNNCKKRKELRISGPLTGVETEKATNQWVQRVQANCEKTSRFNEDKLILNLEKNADGLYECRGRIQGNYPIFLPFEAGFSEELVKDAHLLTIHGGVGLTTELARRHYWIQELARCLKRFVARRGRPEKIYSDNGRTFVAGAKWIRKVKKEEKLQDFLVYQEIKLQFNLSRAP